MSDRRDTISRAILPIPDPARIGQTTYDAKDPDTKRANDDGVGQDFLIVIGLVVLTLASFDHRHSMKVMALIGAFALVAMSFGL